MGLFEFFLVGFVMGVVFICWCKVFRCLCNVVVFLFCRFCSCLIELFLFVMLFVLVSSFLEWCGKGRFFRCLLCCSLMWLW